MSATPQDEALDATLKRFNAEMDAEFELIQWRLFMDSMNASARLLGWRETRRRVTAGQRAAARAAWRSVARYPRWRYTPAQLPQEPADVQELPPPPSR